MSTTRKVVYVGPHDAVYVPVGQIEVHCDRDVPVEFPADVAENLLTQAVWEEPKTTRSAKADVAAPEEG